MRGEDSSRANDLLVLRSHSGTHIDALSHISHNGCQAHVLLLVEHGIPIVEMLQLERLAATGHRVAAIVLAPLALVGATGSPVRPVAPIPA